MSVSLCCELSKYSRREMKRLEVSSGRGRTEASFPHFFTVWQRHGPAAAARLWHHSWNLSKCIPPDPVFVWAKSTASERKELVSRRVSALAAFLHVGMVGMMHVRWEEDWPEAWIGFKGPREWTVLWCNTKSQVPLSSPRWWRVLQSPPSFYRYIASLRLKTLNP